MSRSPDPLHDLVCFHCQQCAEKYLKALMEEIGLTVKKTHDLDDQLTTLSKHAKNMRSHRRGLIFLNQFAVDTRYPGESATKRRSQAALRWAEKIRNEARLLLGITMS